MCCAAFCTTFVACESRPKEETEIIYKPSSLENAVDLGEMDFSAWSGEGADSDDREIKSDKIAGEIKSVFLSSDVNYENNLYKDGKVNIANEENEVKTVDVVICTDSVSENVYLATLSVYTRLITSVKDLRMFDQGTEPSEWRKISGCYALTKNLTDINYLYNSASIYILNYYAVIGTTEEEANNKFGYLVDGEGNFVKEGEIVQYANACSLFGFAGCFDGRGYTLTFSCGAGLFNQLLLGSEVKNVAFKDISVLSSSSHNSPWHDYGRRGPIGYSWEDGNFTKAQVNISDVYISLDKSCFDEGHSEYTKGISILPTSLSGSIAFSNVFVDVNYNYASTDTDEVKDTVKSKNNWYLLSRARYLKDGFTPFSNVLTVIKNKYYENDDYVTPFYLVGDTTKNDKYFQEEYYNENLLVFEDYDEVKESISSEALKAFDNDYWDITKGYPRWKKAI